MVSLATFLEENYTDSEVKLYPTQEEAYLDLANGRIDAVLADVGPFNLWLAADGSACCAFVGDAVVSDDVNSNCTPSGISTALRASLDPMPPGCTRYGTGPRPPAVRPGRLGR